MEFTESDLINALEAARITNTNAAGALTMHELRATTGRSLTVLRRQLWELKTAGRLEVVRVMTERIDGVMTGTTAYRIVTDGNGTTPFR